MVTINFQAWKYGDSQNGCHHTSIPLKSRHHSSIEAVAIVPYPICHHMAMDLVTITIVTLLTGYYSYGDKVHGDMVTYRVWNYGYGPYGTMVTAFS